MNEAILGHAASSPPDIGSKVSIGLSPASLLLLHQVPPSARRFFSVLFVKVQAACLSARIGHLGLQAREAAGRRRDLMMQEERSRREANAYFASYVRGRGRRMA